MLIRSKNRLYYFDRHISDAALRLLVFAISIFFGVTSWLLLIKTDRFIDAVFWYKLQVQFADLAGREVTKLGTSEESIYTRAMRQMEQEGAGITAFPAYAEKLSPNNAMVEMINLRLRDLRLGLTGIGFFFLALFLASFLVVRIIYGSSERRWRWVQWLYQLFNRDGVSRQPYGYVHSFTPIQRKVFEMAFAASKGHPDGQFSYEVDKFATQLWPGEETTGERRRALAAIAFTDLCEEYFYFQIPVRGRSMIKTYSPILPFEDQVKREWVRDIAGREIEVFTAGRFRFSPPLYQEYLRNRYPKLPHAIVYSIDDRKHPFAFRMYLSLWEQLCDQRQESANMQGAPAVPGTTVQVTLFTLLDRACLEMAYDPEAALLEQVHADLSKLKEHGFIRGWSVEEHGERVHPLWFKGVDLFTYDAQANSYRLNSGILTHKVYSFDLVSWADLDQIKIIRRRCGYIDQLNTPCNRAALPNSPYCKRHAKALDPENPELFYQKVKALPPGENTRPQATADEEDATPQPVPPAEAKSPGKGPATPPAAPREADPNEVILTPPPVAPATDSAKPSLTPTSTTNPTAGPSGATPPTAS